MTNFNSQENAKNILDILEKTYPNAKIELNFNPKSPWELLVVVSLSAQTTDKKVNEVSPNLFKNYDNINKFAQASPVQIEPYIKSLGLYKNKAKNLVLAAQKIINYFHSKVPSKRELLETIPGVGKKTAAVIIANIFNQPAIAVDTHVARISRRLGLTSQKSPDKIEIELTNLFAQEKLLTAHHVLIFHGRRTCFARKPQCTLCTVQKLCPKIGVESFV